MASFDDSSFTYSDTGKFKNQGMIVQLAIGRQIDRILNDSGKLFSVDGGFKHSKATVRNLHERLIFLSELVRPYKKGQVDPEIEELNHELDSLVLDGHSSVNEYVKKLRLLFGKIVMNLGYVQLLPPVMKTLESGKDN